VDVLLCRYTVFGSYAKDNLYVIFETVFFFDTKLLLNFIFCQGDMLLLLLAFSVAMPEVLESISEMDEFLSFYVRDENGWPALFDSHVKVQVVVFFAIHNILVISDFTLA
jgi:hypothetical protein